MATAQPFHIDTGQLRPGDPNLGMPASLNPVDVDGDTFMSDLYDVLDIEMVNSEIDRARLTETKILPPSKIPAQLTSEVIDASAIFVIDTNFLISHLQIINEVAHGCENKKSLIIIPRAVMLELDKLKLISKEVTRVIFEDGKRTSRVVSLARLARNASDWLHNALRIQMDNLGTLKFVRGQMPAECIEGGSGDDGVLDALIFYFQDGLKRCALLSNDKNLCIKAMIHGIPTFSYSRGLTGEAIVARTIEKHTAVKQQSLIDALNEMSKPLAQKDPIGPEKLKGLSSFNDSSSEPFKASSSGSLLAAPVAMPRQGLQGPVSSDTPVLEGSRIALSGMLSPIMPKTAPLIADIGLGYDTTTVKLAPKYLGLGDSRYSVPQPMAHNQSGLTKDTESTGNIPTPSLADMATLLPRAKESRYILPHLRAPYTSGILYDDNGSKRTYDDPKLNEALATLSGKDGQSPTASSDIGQPITGLQKINRGDQKPDMTIAKATSVDLAASSLSLGSLGIADSKYAPKAPFHADKLKRTRQPTTVADAKGSRVDWRATVTLPQTTETRNPQPGRRSTMPPELLKLASDVRDLINSFYQTIVDNLPDLMEKVIKGSFEAMNTKEETLDYLRIDLTSYQTSIEAMEKAFIDRWFTVFSFYMPASILHTSIKSGKLSKAKTLWFGWCNAVLVLNNEYAGRIAAWQSWKPQGIPDILDFLDSWEVIWKCLARADVVGNDQERAQFLESATLRMDEFRKQAKRLAWV